MNRPRLRWRLLAAAGAAVLLVLVQRALSQWVDRTGVFISGLAVLVAFVLLLEWLIALYGPGLWRLVRSLSASIAAGISSDPEVARLEDRHPRAVGWLRRRFTLSSPRGLYLTLTVGLTAYFAYGFVSVAKDLVTTSAIVHYDPQLAALLRAFHQPALTRLLWFFTVLGDTRVAGPLTLLAVGVLLIWGRRREAALVAVAVGGGTVLGTLAKTAFQRTRPPVEFAMITQPASYSFPSGHALHSMLFFGVLTFVLVRGLRTLRARLVVIGVAAIAVGLTGVSRVYLGVHWPSDVLAAWCLALAWLSAVCGFYLIRERYGPPARVEPLLALGARRWLTGALCVLAVAAVGYGASRDPLLARALATAPQRAWQVSRAAGGAIAPTQAQVDRLPRFSERLDGSTQNPVGLIFIGSETQLVDAFEAAGWSVAERPGLRSFARAVVAAAANQPYPTAPVTPTFLAGRVQDVAFEKPVGVATVRRRHHTRWWRSGYTLNGQTVWVATASLDQGLEIGSAIPLPTHRIDPDIDAEARYIVADLKRAGSVEVAATVRVTKPSTGTDAQGDPWFTQGLATVLVPTRR